MAKERLDVLLVERGLAGSRERAKRMIMAGEVLVDYLKFDGGFVKDIEHDSVDLAMVETINRIGHILGMRTIAEYAENDAIIAQLREIGVDYAQGYGVSLPMPLVAPGGMQILPRDEEARRR